MKYFLSIILAVVASSALADTLIVNPSNKSSPATVVGLAYKDAVGADAAWYQGENCQDAVEVFNKTPNSVFVYNSSMDFAGRNKGLKCQLPDIKPAQLIFVGREYFDVCKLPSNPRPYNDGKITIGMASMWATKANEADQRANGINATLIPYPGSKDVITAVLSGDIDYGWIGHALTLKLNNKLDCVYSTNPIERNYLGKYKKVAVPDIHIELLIYTNSNNSATIAKLRKAANSEQFKTFVTNSAIEGTYNPTQKDIDTTRKFVNRLSESWGTKQ